MAPLVLDKPTTIHLFDRLSGLEQMVSKLTQVELQSNGYTVEAKDDLTRPISFVAFSSREPVVFPFSQDHLGSTPSDEEFPSREESDMLIQFFLELTEPFIKLIHVPAFQKHLAEYRAGKNPLYFEPLLHCLHSLALAAISSDFVLDFFRRPRDQLLVILRRKAEEALLKADFMRTEQPIIMRALLYFITFLFEVGDIEYASSLVGVALRTAFRIGLHHDFLGQTPFVQDARQRLWLYLRHLDRRASNLQGVESTMKPEWDTPPPQNAFDIVWEEFRTVQENFSGKPSAVTGYTDTSFVLARAEVETLQDGIRSSSMTYGQMETYISEQQSEIWRKYLFNSGSKALPKFIVALMEVYIGAIYLIARQAHHKEANVDFRGQTFMAAIELLEQISALESEMEYIQYIWVLRAFVPIQAIVTVLTCTLFKSDPDCTSRGWQQIDKVYARYDNSDCNLARSSIFEPVNALREQALKVMKQRGMQAQT